MKPHLPLLFLFEVFLAIVVHFPAIWCQTTRSYNACGQQLECGDIRADYPFWGSSRPAYCGHPAFQLICQSDILILNHNSVDYRVLQMDSSTETITIARNDLWSDSCPQYLHNTTFDSTLFNDDNLNKADVFLYYGCNFTTRSNYVFNCDVNDTRSDSYFNMVGSTRGNILVHCNNYMTVPVNEALVSELASPTATTSNLRSALTSGFKLRWTAYDDDCGRCIQSGGRCGSSSTSLELFTCYCANGNFSVTCNYISTESGGPNHGAVLLLKIALGLPCAITGIMFLMFLILRRRRSLSEAQDALQGITIDHQIEIFIRNYTTLAPKRFKYSEIKKMTNSFHKKLGQGGYGSVYQGQLTDGQLVAVKLLGGLGATGDGEDFINEVASISTTSHVNIVTLLGFCFEGMKRALVYKFMPNGSLDKFIRSDGPQMDWYTMFKIAKGIARGLEYLHQGCNTRIVHFDIKPHNILLDEELIPKISDFGLAKLCKRKESIVSVMGARGTAGYMAPEVYFRSLGGASHKSDVYSYGMMVLEMTGARKNNNASAARSSEAYFPDWIYKQVESGENLGVNEVTSVEEDELARKMVIVSLWCIQSDPSDRPSISKVVEMLEGSFQSLQFPPKHFWSSPPRPGTPLSATHSSTIERVSTM